jgi:hypothetical protein
MCRRIGDLVDGSSSLDFIRNLTSLNVLYATFFFSVEHTVLYLFLAKHTVLYLGNVVRY